VDSGMFRGIQDAAVRALQNPASWHDARNREYSERREIIFCLMDKLQCSYDKAQEGMFVWARIPEHVSSSEKFVDSILQENHVFLTPGFIFGAKGERYIRASLCNPNNILEKAFSRVFNF